MAQYEKLINLSLLNQFLTKAKTIFAPKITASGILKGDGAGNVSAATAGTDYLAPSALTPYRTAAAQDVIDAGKEAAGLGLTGTSVGDLVRVNAVDANGKPTSWKKVALNEIKCNKNLLDNWYFVGGGSQTGDDVFPINQRGQTTYSGTGYGIDRWRNNNTQFNVDITSSAIKLYGTNYGNTISQYISNASALLGKTITISAIINGILSYTSFKLPDELPASGTVGSGTLPGIAGINAYLRVLNNKLGFVFYANSAYVAETVVNITAAKLELGSEQTLCHNEGTEANPIWVLNEIPDYGEELAKCQRYFVRLSGNTNFIASGFVASASAVRGTRPMPKMAKLVPSVTVNGTIYVQVLGHAGVGSLASTTVEEASFNSDSLFLYLGGMSNLTGGQGCLMQLRDNTSYIDISAEP